MPAADNFQVRIEDWPDVDRPTPPGHFSPGTSYLAGPQWSDVFQSKRAPTPWRLIESYKSLIFAMVAKNANAVCRIPLRLYTDGSRAQGGKPRAACDPIRATRAVGSRLAREGLVSPSAVDQVYEVRNHPFLSLLDKPDPYGYFNRTKLISLMVRYCDVIGSAYFMPDWDGWNYRAGKQPPDRVPDYLWTLYSQHVLPIRLSSSPLIDRFQYFGDAIPYDRMMWFRQNHSLRDPYGHGYSPAYAGDNYAQQEDKFIAIYDQVLGLGPRPNMIATAKDPLQPPGADELKRFKQDLIRQQAGGYAGGLLVNTGAWDFTPASYAPADMGGKEISEYDVHRLASIFGQPPTYYTVDTNLANLQAADQQHARDGVDPRCKMIAETLTFWIRQYDERLFFQFDPSLPEDEELKTRVLVQKVQAGLMTINQANEDGPLPPVAWGDEPWMPGTLVQPSMAQEKHQMGLTQQAHQIENEGKATEFQYGEGAEQEAEGEGEDAPVERWMKQGNPYHDASGHFTNPGGVGHAAQKGKKPRKKKSAKSQKKTRKSTAHSKSGGGGGKGAAKPASKTAGHTMTASERADRLKKGKPLEGLSAKAIRAQVNQNKTTGEVQQYTKKNEEVLARRLGGKSFPDNDPIDVHAKIGGKEHGIEVKTLTHGRNDKITMKGSALQRKFDWETANKSKMHTVVMDHRDRALGGKNADLHSGNELYYKRGVGSYRIGQMYKVKDDAELKQLLNTPYDKLPKAAKGAIRPHEIQHGIKS